MIINHSMCTRGKTGGCKGKTGGCKRVSGILLQSTLWWRRDLIELVLFKLRPEWREDTTNWLQAGRESIPGSGNCRCQGRGWEEENWKRPSWSGCSEGDSDTRWDCWGGQALVDHKEPSGSYLTCNRASIKRNKRFELGSDMNWFWLFKDLPGCYLEKALQESKWKKGRPIRSLLARDVVARVVGGRNRGLKGFQVS